MFFSRRSGATQRRLRCPPLITIRTPTRSANATASRMSGSVSARVISGSRPLDDRARAPPAPVARRGRRRCLRVRARLRRSSRSSSSSLASRSFFSRRRSWSAGGAPPPSPPPRRADQRGNWNAIPAARPHRALFPGPAIEVHHGDLAAEDAAGRRDGDRRHAVGPRDRDRVAVVVERDRACELRVEVEHLVGVGESAGAGVGEAERRARVDPAGIDVGAGGVDDLAPAGTVTFGADGCDDAVADQDRSRARSSGTRHRDGSARW